jgi:hypothetical protein
MLGALCIRWTVPRESVPNVGHLKYSKVVLTEYLTIPQMDKCLYALKFGIPKPWHQRIDFLGCNEIDLAEYTFIKEYFIDPLPNFIII